MSFKVRGRAALARLTVTVAAAGTLVTLATAPGQAAAAAPSVTAAAAPASVSVQTVLIPVPGQRPVAAYLVQPAGALAVSSQAGILFLHWLGQIHSDRSEFLAEAVELADHGAVSLLPQGLFPWVAAPKGNHSDVTRIHRQLAALQASLNWLTSRSYVNRSRVAIAGHDYGAMYGALLASANRGVRAAVLAAPDATWGHWFVKYWLGFTGHKAAAYKAMFAGLQPVRHGARLGRHEMFQWAGQDIFVSAAVRRAFAKAAPQAKVKLYKDSDHQLTDQAQADRDAFLTRELGLS